MAYQQGSFWIPARWAETPAADDHAKRLEIRAKVALTSPPIKDVDTPLQYAHHIEYLTRVVKDLLAHIHTFHVTCIVLAYPQTYNRDTAISAITTIHGQIDHLETEFIRTIPILNKIDGHPIGKSEEMLNECLHWMRPHSDINYAKQTIEWLEKLIAKNDSITPP